MKHTSNIICTLFTLLIPFLSYSQEINKDNREIVEVVQSNLSSKQLFINARKMLATVYMNFNKELDDDLGYNLIAYGALNVPISEYSDNYTEIKSFRNKTAIFFRLTINCKDNRYRYKINDIILVQDKKFTKTTYNDFVTAYFMQDLNVRTTTNYEYDSYSYFDMDSIFRRDSISYYSTKESFNILLKRKNKARGKEKKEIYKSMSNIGKISLDKEKAFSATNTFHQSSDLYIKSLIYNIKKGMMIEDNW